MFSPKSLHHGMDGDEGTSTTHAITEGARRKGEGLHYKYGCIY